MRPDLNLLVVFDAVASCGSVTLAAGRLALSQPAVSHSLKRLRAHFSDPLFIRKGAGVQPTPRATAIAKDIRQILQAADMVFTNRPFNPARTSRTFKIAASDYALSILLPSLQRKFLSKAPHCQLEIIQADAEAAMRQSAITDQAIVTGHEVTNVQVWSC